LVDASADKKIWRDFYGRPEQRATKIGLTLHAAPRQAFE
jgi:hypothetical protein